MRLARIFCATFIASLALAPQAQAREWWKLVVFGDSWTNGTQKFCGKNQDYGQFCYGWGGSGETTKLTADRIIAELDAPTGRIPPYTQFFLIAAGQNDFKNSGYTGEVWDVDFDFKDPLEAAIQRILQAGYEPVLWTPGPVCADATCAALHPNVFVRGPQMVAAIEGLGAQYGLSIVRIHEAFLALFDAGELPNYYIDSIHPTLTPGFTFITDLVAGVVDTLSVGEPIGPVFAPPEGLVLLHEADFGMNAGNSWGPMHCQSEWLDEVADADLRCGGFTPPIKERSALEGGRSFVHFDSLDLHRATNGESVPALLPRDASERSIYMLVRFTQSKPLAHGFVYGSAGTANEYIMLGQRNGNLHWEVGAGAADRWESTRNIIGEWHAIALVLEAGGDWTLYDGNEALLTGNRTVNTTDTTNPRAGYPLSSGANQYVSADVASVLVYDVAKTGADHAAVIAYLDSFFATVRLPAQTPALSSRGVAGLAVALCLLGLGVCSRRGSPWPAAEDPAARSKASAAVGGRRRAPESAALSRARPRRAATARGRPAAPR